MQKAIADKRIIGGRECLIYDCGSPDVLLIQPVDDHDIEVLDSEVNKIRELMNGAAASAAGCAVGGAADGPVSEPASGPAWGFTLAAFRVNDWNTDLSPWEAAPVFGDAGFGSGAEDTLKYILESLIPELTGYGTSAGTEVDTHAKTQVETQTYAQADSQTDTQNDTQGNTQTNKQAEVKIYLGGYSLAGFFSLWAAYQTDRFAGVAAVSPSVWFPGWMDFAREHSIRAPRVYLSLGDKEERTRNPVMRTVGDNIRSQLELLESDAGCNACTLEMNQGNHFKEPDLRTAKGFAWLLSVSTR